MKYLAYPHDLGYGGPGTFQNLLFQELPKYGWEVLPAGTLENADLLFVNIGTRKLSFLHKAKRKGIPILHRLDGINWGQTFSLRNCKDVAIQQARNHLVNYIRTKVADKVVYQSRYIEKSWVHHYGKTKASSHIIYNFTDTELFRPPNAHHVFDKIQILCVEGTVQFNDEMLVLFQKLSQLVNAGFVERISIVGKIKPEDKQRLEMLEGICVLGPQPRDTMPSIFQDHNLFLCLEINPPCPNSVIEALSSGLPVCGYDTGSLRELAGSEAGMYGNQSDPGSKYFIPDADLLVKAITESKISYESMATYARSRALKFFNKDINIKKYVDIFDNLV